MNKTLIIASLTLALGAGLAQAQTAPSPPSATQAAPPAPAGDFGSRFERGRRGPGPWMGRRMRPTQEEVQKRNADAFARMDADRNGRVTFEEYRQDLERRRLERQRQMFQRFSGGQDSVTLDQLNARAAQRFDRGGRGRGGPGGRGPSQETRPSR